jgi:hypothetical protein
MRIGKYKYYFTKPKSEIVKDVFSWLFIGGAVAIAATSPYFLRSLLHSASQWKKYPKRKVSDTFYQLRKQGFLNWKEVNNQIYISLTLEGKKKAGMFQLDALKISRPKHWDGNWRVFIFDIPDKKKPAREALRGKLRELGFVKVQESAWVHAFDCGAEIDLLKDFFGLSEKEARLMVVENIGDDTWLKRIFNLL